MRKPRQFKSSPSASFSFWNQEDFSFAGSEPSEFNPYERGSKRRIKDPFIRFWK